MDAWTSDPSATAQYLATAHRSNARARSSFRINSAATATPSAASGGQRGPALDAIASRMTEDQIIRQVLQGGGNMPAYGNALNPSETKALVSFSPPCAAMTPRAIDASRNLAHGNSLSVPQSSATQAAHKAP